ncbi:hypothetical protein Vadar_015891 [Vaccinium darrowii]|uniref:Uncharacterized protein n=1 Tax=Vaccinium darrowii TaxID=229202 RepID=A0ACB7XA30_9ERIC|nr:hypothetical protein Vadar_015891 [Vaccinium darrowii]
MDTKQLKPYGKIERKSIKTGQIVGEVTASLDAKKALRDALKIQEKYLSSCESNLNKAQKWKGQFSLLL